MTIYEELGLAKVINASGKMTALGVSTIHADTGKYMQEAAMSFVNIEALIDKAGQVISEYTGGEDSCVTLGASAGIAITVASMISKGQMDIVERLPLSEGLANEIIIQKGHCVNFGAPVNQMIRLGGGVVKEVGHSNKTEDFHIRNAINENTAAILYIKSHHTVQKGMLSLEKVCEIASEKNIPVIVDAAAEEDLKRYLAIGADLVIYSGAKAIEGPTSGLITGKSEKIKWCKLQYKGIGRAMKVGKENIMGLLKALQIYQNKDKTTQALENKKRMGVFIEKINQIKGLKGSVVKDEAGREIYRAAIKVDERVLGVNAEYIINELKKGSVQIYVREHYSNLGIINIDPRPLQDKEEDIIYERIVEIVNNI